MANWDLIKKTLDNIDKHPSSFDMSDWAVNRSEFAVPTDVCETSMCFAGWVVVSAGEELVWTADTADAWSRAPLVRDKDGLLHHISHRATHLLDISTYEADQIYYSGPATPADMRAVIEKVLGEEN